MTSGTVAIALIVLVWLFVLAPMFLRGHKPISKAGDAFDETRVVYKGGSKPLDTPLQPKISAKDVHLIRTEDAAADAEYAQVSAESSLSEPATEVVPEVVDGEVIYELPAGYDVAEHTNVLPENGTADDEYAGSVSEFDAEDLVEEYDAAEYAQQTTANGAGYNDAALDNFDDYEAEEDAYSYDEAYVSPEDLLYPGKAEEEVVEEPAAAYREDLADSELTEEEMDFALHRARRGGWNPQAEMAARAVRLQRRKRTLGGMSLLVALSFIAAVLWGGFGWTMTLISVGILALYLVTLRKQVRAEQQLHARRVEQLRRARLGVANAEDTELGIPQRLRHPGAVVLELDDESPDFEELDVITPDNREQLGFDHSSLERRVG
ncbi:MAG: hypothetical protein Q3976_00360 [Corynebacterium sp.]|nr:hypothetical protein [Corynebacterium sp.]